MSLSFISEANFKNGIHSLVQRCIKTGIYTVTASQGDSVMVLECFGLNDVIETERDISTNNIIFA